MISAGKICVTPVSLVVSAWSFIRKTFKMSLFKRSFYFLGKEEEDGERKQGGDKALASRRLELEQMAVLSPSASPSEKALFYL